jgi:hypothetical protein
MRNRQRSCYDSLAALFPRSIHFKSSSSLLRHEKYIPRPAAEMRTLRVIYFRTVLKFDCRIGQCVLILCNPNQLRESQVRQACEVRSPLKCHCDSRPAKDGVMKRSHRADLSCHRDCHPLEACRIQPARETHWAPATVAEV